jgi:hypothetical protein
MDDDEDDVGFDDEDRTGVNDEEGDCEELGTEMLR